MTNSMYNVQTICTLIQYSVNGLNAEDYITLHYIRKLFIVA